MIAIKKDAMRYRDPETGEFVGVSLIGGDAPSSGTPVEIDGTLTQSGKAADAKVVGDQLSALNAANAAQDERLNTLEQAGGIVTVEPAQDDVPIVFFGGDLPQTKTATVMPFKYVSKSKTVSGYVKAKAQGNSSMSYPKKNQTVNMYADEALVDSLKVDFKGWGAQKKHVYKANWIDLTHARNVVSAQLWGDVVKSRANYNDLPELFRTSPNQGAIDGFPALVYANGVYQGRYTINIPKDGWMANMDKTLDTHCILCGENYVSGCFRAAANINGSDWSDELHDTVPATIKTRWNEVISFVMNSTDAEFKANLGNYFYVDSLIDYLLFALASCGLDSMGKNQIYMTYDGQKWIASMYDMDSTWGLYWNGSSFVASDYARTSYEDYVSGREGNLLYIRLEQNFYEEIQARWAELREGALSYANIITRFERFIGVVPPHIVKEDYASTTGGGKFTGIPSQGTNHIQQIRSFAAARLEWTDEYVAALTPAEEIPCTGITLDQSTLTFTAAGTQTLTATVTPSNTTDAVVWTSNADTIASVSGGVVTAKANGSATITATCGSYSATCAVSVSGIESGGNTPSEDILYQLAEPMTFNGTSDYIDTGVKLLESDIDHSIVFSAVAETRNILNSTIFHCMTEISPYPGYAFAVAGGGNSYKLGIPGGQEIVTNVPSNDSSFKVVITHIKGSSTVNMKILYNGEVKTYTADNSNYVTVPQNLLIGCYQTTDGVRGRYWNGTINDFRIYNRVLSNEEITAYFAVVPCTGITLDQTELTFNGAGTQTLIATVTPSNTTDTVVWSSNAPSIASVSNGVVKAKANGSATITATCGAYSATCTVSVSGIEESTEPPALIDVNASTLSNGDTSWKNLDGTSAFVFSKGITLDNDGLLMSSAFVNADNSVNLNGEFTAETTFTCHSAPSNREYVPFAIWQGSSTKYCDSITPSMVYRVRGFDNDVNTNAAIELNVEITVRTVYGADGKITVYKNGLLVGEYTRNTYTAQGDYAIYLGKGSMGQTSNTYAGNNYSIKAFRFWDSAVHVPKIPCTGITLDKTELTFSASGTQTLTATVTPSDTNDIVVWSSNAPSIASVSGGVVTAKANGSATITAKCGTYSATCAVSISGIETDIDYTHNPLSGISWIDGSTYNRGTGELITSTNEHCTPRFSLQNCVYEVNFGDDNSYEDVYVWDENGTYVGTIGTPGTDVGYISGVDGYQYALKVYRTVDSDMSGVTMAVVNNESTAVETTIDLSAVTWKASGKNTVEVDIAGYGFSTSNYMNSVQKTNYTIVLFKSYSGNALNGTGNGTLFYIEPYNNQVLLSAVGFRKDTAAAAAYFADKEPLVFSK